MNRAISLRRLALLSALAVLATLGVACGGGGAPPGSAAPANLPVVEIDARLTASLQPFEGCEELLGYYRQRTLEMSQEMGFFVMGRDDMAVADGAPVRRSVVVSGEASSGGGGDADMSVPLLASGPETGGQGDGGDYSTTNIQEQGVDEPDMAKSDGKRIVLVQGERLVVVSADGGAPTVRGSVKLPGQGGDHQLFLTGDRAFVLTRSWSAHPVDAPAAVAMDMDMAGGMVVGGGRTVVSIVDLSDADAPRVVEHRGFEGELVSARLHEGRARVVLRSSPTVPLPEVPLEQQAQMTPEDAGAAYEAAVNRADLETFLPGMTAPGGSETDPADEPAVDCSDVSRPPEPSGSGTVTVLTFDAAGSVEPLDSVAVVADAQTVYASTDSLYVATSEWVPPQGEEDRPARWKGRRAPAPERYTTAIHAFDLEGDGTKYVGSGRVVGQLLNQWSLSEQDGFLRVATTEGSPWAGPGQGSESFLTVLERQGERLVRKGAVGGLGPGETIQSVRFIGDLGYVVTFRQTDPLYVLDLSDPSSPRVLGELKVTGFSSYLHPVADDRLLGVGQAADEQGRTQGLQVSLFDIGEPTKPALVDRETLRNGYSNAEHDHRAFLWWPGDGVAVVPASAWDERGSDQFGGALVFDVSSGAVDERGRISHASHQPASPPPVKAGPGQEMVVVPDFLPTPEISRSLVVGDTLYTVSHLGVMASDLGSLDEKGWAALPQ